MSKPLSTILFTTLLTLSTTVHAERDPKQSPAHDEIVLTQGAVNRLEKNLADKADWATDRDARERARTSIQMVEPALARIRKADPSWDVTRWSKLLADAKARLVAADAALAKDAANAKAVDSLRYEYKSAIARDTMELLTVIDGKPDTLTHRTPGTVKRVIADIAKVKSLDELCKAKNLAALPMSKGAGAGTFSEDPAVGCPLAAKYRELGAKFFELQVHLNVALKVKAFERAIGAVKSGERIEVAMHHSLLKPADAVAAMRSELEAAGNDLALTVDSAWLEPITAATITYPAALAEAAKVSRWDAQAKLQDPQITAGLAGDHGKAGDLEKGKVLRAAAFTDWSIEKDVWKRPVSRSRNVLALVKIDGESYCRVYSYTFVAKHTDDGKWSKPHSMGGSGFQVSACK